jgi:hypothetical protein
MPDEFAFFQIPGGLDGRIWDIAKLFVLVGLLVYLVFAIVVIRQVQLMTRTVTGDLDKAIRVISWVHFGLSAGIFILALLFL